MNDSILISVKQALGLTSDYTYFDSDIIMHINSVFMVLNQLGIGPEEGFSIIGSAETWSDFTDVSNIQALKTYMYLRVKLLFDPPSSSFVLTSYENQISELTWRLNVMVDPE